MKLLPLFATHTYYERVTHKWYPADEKTGGFGELQFLIPGGGEAYIRIHGPHEVDAVIAQLVELRAEMTAPVGCPASTDLDDEIAFCDKAVGHKGNHHAAVSDVSGGYEVAWPNPCGARPYPAGSEGDDGTECTLPVGHDGPHDDAEPDDAWRLTAKGEATFCSDVGPDGVRCTRQPHTGVGDHKNVLGGQVWEQPGAKPETNPVGLCGHPVNGAAWAAGFGVCRDCSSPGAQADYDKAALTAAELEPQP